MSLTEQLLEAEQLLDAEQLLAERFLAEQLLDASCPSTEQLKKELQEG